MIEVLKTIMSRLVAKRLNRRTTHYFYRIPNNMENMKKHIRKGDVVLVEGDQRLSELIKMFSQSHWSHSAFYIGDELIRTENPHKDEVLNKFGDKAKHLLVEALTTKGVIVSPIDIYEFYNTRVCRPFAISEKDVNKVIEIVISHIGKPYDNRNIYHLALSLIPPWMNPWRKRSVEICLGNCDEFQVTCSGMIAKAFQFVGYPISPAIHNDEDKKEVFAGDSPYGHSFTKRHYSQISPADYDLSPNFEIVKFNIIKDGRFDYKSLNLLGK